MIGIDILRGLITAAPAPRTVAEGFVHVDLETAATMVAAKRIDLSVIACLAKGDLADGARRAIGAGRDIVWIGLAPKDVDIGPEGFTATVSMRIDGEASPRSVLLRGDADNGITSVSEIVVPTHDTTRLEKP